MGNEQGSILQSPEFPFPAMSNCRIVVVGPRNGDDCLIELANLPPEARILATGSNIEELRIDNNLFTEGNVLLNVSGNAKTLGEIIDEMPFLTWVHSITAGVDHLLCPQIVDNDDIVLTNAKGVFSHSLGEYVVAAMMHFAKQIPRLMQQKAETKWDSFCVSELRGKTLGIVGYGNIGQACARLSKPFGMRVLALRKRPQHSEKDGYVDEVMGMSELNYIMEQSDFVVVAMALTPETRLFVRKEHFARSKAGQVLINIGRGALIDEQALAEALREGRLHGAALDVFTVEPLPAESPLWRLPNVLLSPHNADLLVDSRQKSVRFFTENCRRFLANEELECIVDKRAGY